MELLVLFLLILLNGLFAMSELAVVTAKRPRLEAKAEEGDRGARAALRLLDDPSRMLSTVQIGITLIGIVAGAYGATAIADDLAPLIADRAPAAARFADDISFGVVIILTTYLSLVLGELAPKRLALAAPETIAGLAAPGLSVISLAAAPLVWVLKTSTEGLLRIVGLHRTKRPFVTEEEIHALIEEGQTAGIIEPEEREMISGVMRLGDRRARAIMTPRREIVWLDPNRPWAENARLIRESGHTRFPVAEGGADNVIGVLHTKDIAAAGAEVDLRAVMRPVTFIPENVTVLRLLKRMRKGPVRMLFVTDEYGALEGIITPADILEAIAGDVALSVDEAIATPVRRGDGSWLIDGMTPIDEFEQFIGVRGLADEANVDTVAGLVVTMMQKLPEAGDRIASGPLDFEVVDMDGRRVDKIIVRRNFGEDDASSPDI